MRRRQRAGSGGGEAQQRAAVPPRKSMKKKTHSGVDLHFKLGRHPDKPADVRSPLMLTLISSLRPACLRILCPSPRSYLGVDDLFIFQSGSVPSVSTCHPVILLLFLCLVNSPDMTRVHPLLPPFAPLFRKLVLKHTVLEISSL